MLSRVAEHLYWMARYLERAEDMARLINATTLLLLDLPPKAHFGWDILVTIAGLSDQYEKHYGPPEEHRIMGFLIADERNPSSIASCIHQARENSRTFREILPTEFWERINSLFLFVRDYASASIGNRHDRYAFLSEVIARRHALVGLLVGSMSQDSAYHFIKLGRNIERADMTTRIVDVTTAVILPQRDSLRATLSESLWTGVLRAMSAFEMYRRHVSVEVRGNEVVEFLIRDRRFPRAVRHCLGEMEVALASLPVNAASQGAVRRARSRLERLSLADLHPALLHEYVDYVQQDLGSINRVISRQYFEPLYRDSSGDIRSEEFSPVDRFNTPLTTSTQHQ